MFTLCNLRYRRLLFVYSHHIILIMPPNEPLCHLIFFFFFFAKCFTSSCHPHLIIITIVSYHFSLQYAEKYCNVSSERLEKNRKDSLFSAKLATRWFTHIPVPSSHPNRSRDATSSVLSSEEHGLSEEQGRRLGEYRR